MPFTVFQTTNMANVLTTVSSKINNEYLVKPSTSVTDSNDKNEYIEQKIESMEIENC